MSKMSDMAMTIEELRSAAAAINEAANWLAEQFDTMRLPTKFSNFESSVKNALLTPLPKMHRLQESTNCRITL